MLLEKTDQFWCLQYIEYQHFYHLFSNLFLIELMFKYVSLELLFRKTYALSIGFKLKPLRKNVFLCQKQKLTQFLQKNLLIEAIVHFYCLFLTFLIWSITFILKKVRSSQASISVNSCSMNWVKHRLSSEYR